MHSKHGVSRRNFLKTGAAVGAGFTIAFYLPGRLSPHRQRSVAPVGTNAWIDIDPNGTITLALDRTEMGQGVMTVFAMILVEELDADWNRVSVAPVVDNPAAWPRKLETAARRSVRSSYKMLRKMQVPLRAKCWSRRRQSSEG